MTPTVTTPGAALHAVIERHRAAGQLYAIVDSARDRPLAQAAVDRCGLQRWSLFPRTTTARMTAVAPFLVSVPFEARYPFAASGFFDLLAARFGGSAGVLLTSTADTHTLWEHLRDVFLASDEEGNQFFFRFYDPRVLRGFLPSLTHSEAAEFFGPVRMLFVEGEAPGEVLVCRPGSDGVRVERAGLH
jgi:hypothetical protein